jgi:NAD+ synthase
MSAAKKTPARNGAAKTKARAPRGKTKRATAVGEEAASATEAGAPRRKTKRSAASANRAAAASSVAEKRAPRGKAKRGASDANGGENASEARARAPRRKSRRAAAANGAEPATSDARGGARRRTAKRDAKPEEAGESAGNEAGATPPSEREVPHNTPPSRAPRGAERNGAMDGAPWPAFPTTNYALTEKVLVRFVRDEVTRVGMSNVVLGLSGGVDSACAAAIAVRALGADHVLAVNMPYRSSSPASARDADAVADALGVELRTIAITAQIDAYFAVQTDASKERRGNKMARERMTILYDLSAAQRALVLGTSNKTELLLGYGTLFGDMASALNPIGDLYKTQIWGLAAHVGVPQEIVEKAPSADLWEGQTDEHELGFGYREVDALLYRMVDERWSDTELAAAGFDTSLVERVRKMVRSSQFKRRLPLIAKISERTIDADFRYPRDWGT